MSPNKPPPHQSTRLNLPFRLISADKAQPNHIADGQNEKPPDTPNIAKMSVRLPNKAQRRPHNQKPAPKYKARIFPLILPYQNKPETKLTKHARHRSTKSPKSKSNPAFPHSKTQTANQSPRSKSDSNRTSKKNRQINFSRKKPF